MTNSTSEKSTNVWKERKNDVAGIRAFIVSDLANAAFEIFQKRAKLTEEEMNEFRTITKDATIVFTQPSEETLKADSASENPRFTKGRAFGSIQWYKKSQVVETALNVVSSYSSYLSYMETKENQAERDEKKLAAAAALLGVDLETLKALKK
ncbi:hypothetical protein [Prevotella sp. E2-28]|uniref:hypothetical protein n=1 Tax=Prevotella sp. E2-28 TaxID=2913620 RepID=UPI001EDBB610|nr:hypothetical protein [Prevotella sp. E2-28]UKK52690.1 hypothetical protein L6465_08740 [Prevotella sp. E2-28]